MKAYIGIDPGKSGGIAVLKEDGHLLLYTIPKIGKLVDLKEIASILGGFNKEFESFFALENVHSLPGVSAKSNFSFGENKGEYRGMLVALGCSYMEVTPKGWQKVAWEGIPLMKKANKRNDTKAMSLTAATRIWPQMSFLATTRSSVPHDGLVDAALIAYYLKCKNK